ncbi:MAG: serine/threonine-protein kinase [Isosphaeraceae bacterium]
MRNEPTDAAGDDALGPIVESFLVHRRRGELVSPEEYAARYPGQADRLRSLLPAVDGLEQLAGASVPSTNATEPLLSLELPAPFGRYDLLQELGRGGMGVVYRAWDRDARRVVALKVIRPDSLEDARFRFEVGVLARLEHDHVVPLYEAGEHEGVRYFTMRFVEGGALDGRIEEYEVPATATRPGAERAMRRAAALMAGVARAVGYVHRRGVLHRDLKPGNILLGADGRPLVSDFGLARRFAADALAVTLAGALTEDQESRPGGVVGTMGYMAPEQLAGRGDLTTAADVFSLGAVLYRLLAGGLPFPPGSPAGLAALLDPQSEVPPPSGRNRSVPAGCDLEWVCLKCLAKDPAERYATAEALAEDLDRAARGEPVRRDDRDWAARVLAVLRRRKRTPDDQGWGLVDLATAALNLVLHAGFYALIRVEAAAAVCWAWYLTFEAVSWSVFVGGLFRRRSAEAAERDLLVLWAGVSLAGLTLFGLYCPPGGASGAAGLLDLYPPWAVVTGLAMFLIGRIHWGGFYLMGLAFFLLAALMPLAPRYAPLAYGALVALGLCWAGLVHTRGAGPRPTARR